MASRFFLLILPLVFAAIEEEDSVWILTEKNLKEAFRKQSEIFVFFYTNDCNYCKKLFKPFSSAAKRLKLQIPPIQIASIDASAYPALASKYKASSFPSFKYITQDKEEEFPGSRSEDGFVSWVLKKNNKSFSIINDLQTLQSRIPKSKVTVVYFGDLDTNEYRVFTVASRTVDDPSFIVCSDAKARAHFKVLAPSIVLLKQFDEKRVDFEGNFVTSEIVEFVEKHKFPLIVEFNEVVDDYIYMKRKICLLLLRHNSEAKDYEKMLKKISMQLERKIVVSYLDVSTEEFRGIAANFGVFGKRQPMALILDPAHDYRYLLEGTITEDSIKQFLKDWKQKKLTPLVRSQDLPEREFENSVRVLVAKNFEQVVMDKEKNVLVQFYAGGSNEVLRFKMTYERVAKTVKEVGVEACKIDMGQNEIRGMKFDKYPVVMLYSASNKKGVRYEGDLDEGKIIEFVEKQVKAKLEL